MHNFPLGFAVAELQELCTICANCLSLSVRFRTKETNFYATNFDLRNCPTHSDLHLSLLQPAIDTDGASKGVAVPRNFVCRREQPPFERTTSLSAKG